MQKPPASDLIRHFKAFLEESGLSHVSVKNYVSDVRQFLSWAHITSALFITDKQIQEYLHQIEKTKPASTYRRYLASMRRFVTFLSVEYRINLAPLVVEQTPVKPASNETTILELTALFRLYLEDEQRAPATIKNYISDLNHFYQWIAKSVPISPNSTPEEGIPLSQILNPKTLKDYLNYLKLSHTKTSVAHRRQAAINKFVKFAIDKHLIVETPTKVKPPPLAWFRRYQSTNRLIEEGGGKLTLYQRYNSLRFTPYLHLALLVLFAAGLGIFAYIQFILEATPQFAFPAALTRPTRQLSFQGRLTDSSDTPISTSTNVSFKIWDQLTGGTEGTCTSQGGEDCLYQTGTCTVDPDQDGIFNVLIGDGVCGGEIPSSVFSENPSVFLEVLVGIQTLTPRQQIATVAFALNSETLQGYPASESATANTVPVMNNNGDIVLGSPSPTIQSTSGTFSIEGQAVSIITSVGSNGNITIAPDGTGQILLSGGTTTQDFLRIVNANLSTGSLISGYIGNNTSTGELLRLSSGSVETDRFVVGAFGQTTIDAAAKGKAALIVNQLDTGPIFAASAAGVNQFLIANNGDVTIAGDLAVNGGDITTSQTTFNLVNTTATTLNIGGAATTMNVGPGAATAASLNLVGGSGATGCTADGATGNFTCSGNITSTATGTPSVGYWTRNTASGYLYPSTLGDFVGINTATPGEQLDINGDIRLTNFRTRTMTRTIPTTVGDEVDIGAFALSNGAGSFWASITVPSAGFSVAKEYIFPVQSSMNPNNTWVKILPVSSTGSFSSQDFDLEGNVNTNTFSLRIRRASGTTAGTAYIVIKQEGVNTDAFTPSTATSTVSAPTQILSTTALTQTGGTVTIPNLGVAGAVVYTDAGGTLGITAQGVSGECLTSAGAGTPVWDACSSGTGSNWQRNLGVLSPLNITDDLAIGGISTASATFHVISGTGDVRTSGDLAVNGGDLTTTDTTFNLINTTATTLNVGGAATTMNVGPGGATAATLNFVGGSGATGCTVDGATGNFTCAGDVGVNGGDLTTTATTFNLINATATTLNIGGAATSMSIGPGGATSANIDIAGGSGATGCTIAGASGNLTCSGDVGVNGGDLTTTATTFNLINATATTLNVGGAATTMNVGPGGATAATLNFVGGSGATGCTVDGATGNFTCTGNIVGSGSGIVGYWQRNAQALSPTFITDDVLTGAIATASALVKLTGTPGNDSWINTGRFGVGTTTPDAKLEVVSDLGTLPAASIAATSTFAALVVDNNLGDIFAASSSGLNRFVIANNGNVGIGTTTPDYLLTVTGSQTDYLASIYNTGTATSSAGLFVRTDSDGNILTLNASGSDIITVTAIQTTVNNPTSFTSPGDVSISYDLNFTNPTASYITSDAPLYIEAGETFNSSDLTLRTFNKGNVIIDSEALVVNNSATIAADLAVNGGDITTTSTTFNLLNETATTINFAGDASTLNIGPDGATATSINLAGGSADTGCTVDGATGNFSCSGNIIGSSTGIVGYWQRNAQALSPTFITDDVLTGGIATASALVKLTGTPGNFSWINTGRVGIGTTTPLATLDVRAMIGTVPAASISGATAMATLIVDNSFNQDIFTASSSGATRLVLGTSGDLTLYPSNTTGGQTGRLMPSTHGIQDIGGISNKWRTLFLTNSIQAGPSGSGNVVIDIANQHLSDGSGIGSWTIDVDASVSGNLNVVGTTWLGCDVAAPTGCGNPQGAVMIAGVSGTGKIDVGTVDPPYTINGEKYATYLAGMVGQNEEVTGHLTTSELVTNIGYKTTIDFSNLPKASDLWLFSKVTDLKKHIANMTVILTPGSGTRSWYEIDPNKMLLSIYTSKPSSVSYRFTAPRFDSNKWLNTRPPDSVAGFVLSNPDQPLNNVASGPIDLSSSFTETNINQYELSIGPSLITEIGSYANLLVANLTTGIVNTRKLIANVANIGEVRTDKLISPLAQVDTLTVNDKITAPLAQIDSIVASTISAESIVADDVTLSGTLYAQEISSPTIDSLNDRFDTLSGEYATASSILASIKAKYGSFDSLLNPSGEDPMGTEDFIDENATLSGEYALYNQPVIITDSLLVNSTLMSNSLNSSQGTLYIQPIGDSPINLLAGLMTLTPDGNVAINGNLTITGDLYANNINSNRTITDQLNTTNATVSGQLVLGTQAPSATDSGQLLSLFNNQGDLVGAIDASGAASFNQIASQNNIVTSGLIIATPTGPSAEASSSATLGTNATIGTATIQAGSIEVEVSNYSVKSGTYVYLTPISDTNNQVLYVKSKAEGVGFTVAISQPLPQDTTFNYWLIQTQP